MNETLNYSNIQSLLDIARLSTNKYIPNNTVIQVSVWSEEELEKIKQLIKKQLDKLTNE